MTIRPLRLTWISLGLVLGACGGDAFTNDQASEGVEGVDAGASSSAPGATQPGGPSPIGDEPGASDDAAADDDNTGGGATLPGVDDAADDAPGGDEPVVDDSSDDVSGDDVPSDDATNDPGAGGAPNVEPDPPPPDDPTGEPTECPDQCGVIAICQLCDDGSCATPEIACNPDGSCGSVTWTCAGEQDGGSTPMPPVEPPEEEPCAGLSCGEPCYSCTPGLLCLLAPSGPGYCDAAGACVPTEPKCDGEEPVPSCDCPVPEICRLCDDDSCAAPVSQCDEQGECVGVEWECPGAGAECQMASDCAVDTGCMQCENGAEWCPEAVCDDGLCGASANLCPEQYVPCEGKDDGESCRACSPLDEDCIESGEIKACYDGRCQSAVSEAQ